MALKTFKPVTPSLRQLVIVDRCALYKGKPVKTLTEGKSSAGGRNNLWSHHRPLPRRWAQAGLSPGRLQARQA